MATVQKAQSSTNLNDQDQNSGGDGLKEETKSHEYANGCFYEGQWRANRRHGQGTFKWPSGTTYTGEFRNDRRHGQGKIIYADGTKYVGEWRND